MPLSAHLALDTQTDPLRASCDFLRTISAARKVFAHDQRLDKRRELGVERREEDDPAVDLQQAQTER